jgi:hypothetical protein
MSEVAPDLSAIPVEYQDLREDFSKDRATSLHYLSGPETKAMETYIEDSLAAGRIRPFAGAGFFFVGKNKTMCPCINYWGLNDIPVKTATCHHLSI